MDFLQNAFQGDTSASDQTLYVAVKCRLRTTVAAHLSRNFVAGYSEVVSPLLNQETPS